MAKLKDGFYKQTAEAVGSDLHVLLAGGGSKLLSDFATASALSDYVTLATAQTISGVKTFNAGNVPIKLNSTGNEVGVQFLLSSTAKGWVGHTNTTGTYIYNYPSGKYIGVKDDGTPYYHNGAFRTLLHSGNYSSYALPLSGGTLTSASKIPLIITSTDTYSCIRFTSKNTDQVTFGIKENGTLFVTNIDGWSNEYAIYHQGNLTKVSQLTNDAGYITSYKDTAAGKTFKTLSSISHTGWVNNTTDDKIIPTMSFMAYWNGAYASTNASNLTYSANGVIIGSSNYTTYTVKKDGTGASGTWGINVTGNADTVDNVHLEWSGSQAASSTEWLAGWTADGTKIKAVKRADLSVNYATSAGNANTLDNIDSTGFLRKVTVANNAENDFNTFGSMTLTGRGDPTTGASLKNAPWSGSGPAGGYGTLTYLWSGYGTQLAWGYNSNRIYIRNKYYSSGAVWSTTWDSLALTSEIPSVGNGTITIKQNGSLVGSFTTNQSSDATFDLTGGSTDTNYYPIRSYTSGLQISSYSGSTNCQLYVPNASYTQSGVVTTADQTFAGQKTFASIRLRSGGTGNSGGYLYFGDGSYAYLAELSDDRLTLNATALYLGISGTQKYYIDGSVFRPVTSNSTSTTGIALGNSSYRFTYGYFAASVYASAGFYESSDERLKRILNPVKVNLDDLSKLRKIYYLWNDKPEDGRQLGMIAQDVQRLYPELVSVDKETGMLSLAYDRLSVLALEAIDVLYKEHKKLKERVDELEKLLTNRGIL